MKYEDGTGKRKKKRNDRTMALDWTDWIGPGLSWTGTLIPIDMVRA